MTFEMIVFKLQTAAAKLQNKKPGPFLNNLSIGGGAMLTQFLMAASFAKVLAEGEKQCRIQKNAKRVTRK